MMTLVDCTHFRKQVTAMRCVVNSNGMVVKKRRKPREGEGWQGARGTCGRPKGGGSAGHPSWGFPPFSA